mgnify:FL=1|jgi:superfamily II DNA or RNA helicase|tara:strand:- start:33 stop:1682 length:1650 start_codon:yes stop_codon:yes gene_type:complete
MHHFKLREPQIHTKDNMAKEVAKGNKKLLVMAATGFGKTILAYDIIKNATAKGNQVLFTSHRIQLAEQSFKKFKGLEPQYLQGDNKDVSKDYKCLVATLQTLSNVDISPPKIVIIDEVHYAYESNLVQSLFDRFPNAIFIGLSATPTDNKGYLLDGFDAIIDDYQTKDLIDLGWLVPFKCYSSLSIDLSNVKAKGNDYDERLLEETINKEDINKSIVNNYLDNGERRQFICFGVNKNHCTELEKEFGNRNIITKSITASTSTKQREIILQDYKEELIQGLISIEILTAGFDEPKVSCIIMATKTMQWKKYIQCLGRGIRLLGNTLEESISNGKSDCIVLDCCENIKEHGLPDERKVLRFGKKISKVIDRELNLDTDNETRKLKTITTEKQVFLKRIGSLLDLYDGKVYLKESDLQEDVNSFLKKTGYFWWRQNSGKAFMNGRWVHFASKSGLPDNTVFYKDTSFYFGMELKLPRGVLTKHQKETLPEMIRQNVLFFICQSVYDVYKCIEHIENNTSFTEDSFIVKNSIYALNETQINYRRRLKLTTLNK